MPARPRDAHRVSSTASVLEMTALRCRGRVARLVFVSVGMGIGAGVSAQQPLAPVYRCTEPGGTVLYADYPCKGGAQVDIRAGTAAPDATERLARARDELDRSAARRAAAEEAAALRREARNARLDALDTAGYTGAAVAAPEVSYLPAYGYLIPRAKAHRTKARPPAAPARAVPSHRVPVVRPR